MITNIERNFLEIRSINSLLEVPKPSKNIELNFLEIPNFQLNRFFYKQIGKKHKWVDRLLWTEKNWMEYLNNKNVKTYILNEKNNPAGYFEQIFHNENEDCEIAYFGILEEFIGKKYGGYLLTESIKRSFNFVVNRVWGHTCSLDHRHALKNYKSRGMKIFKTENVILNSS